MRKVLLFLGLVAAILPVTSFAALGGNAPTADDIRAHYADGTLKVLIVPGHDLVRSGTAFGKYTEADVVLQLGYALRSYLAADPKVHVEISRGPDGDYASWLKLYVEDHGPEILAYRAEQRAKMHEAITTGAAASVVNVYHNTADIDTATYLFAINKYANDNNIDLVIHLHANDYAGRRPGEIGPYTGYTIYVPEKQYGNAATTRSIAESLRTALSSVLGETTLPAERGTIVEDQDLIAVGANGTRDGASLLVEYGYIYEPHLRFDAIRPTMLKELAYQTYRGLMSFLKPGESITSKTTLLTNNWNSTLKKGMTGSLAVLRLQAALHDQGLYPPAPLTLTDCPLSGTFGDCTEDALVNFQQKKLGYNTGTYGPATKALLTRLYQRPEVAKKPPVKGSSMQASVVDSLR